MIIQDTYFYSQLMRQLNSNRKQGIDKKMPVQLNTYLPINLFSQNHKFSSSFKIPVI